MSDFPTLLILVLFIVGVVIYFVPTILAIERRHRNKTAIIVLNVLTGWSFIGWIVALIWSLSAQDSHGPQARYNNGTGFYPPPPPPPPNFSHVTPQISGNTGLTTNSPLPPTAGHKSIPLRFDRKAKIWAGVAAAFTAVVIVGRPIFNRVTPSSLAKTFLSSSTAPDLAVFPTFNVYRGKDDGGDGDGHGAEPTSGARLCIDNSGECFELAPDPGNDKGVVDKNSYFFGFNPKATTIDVPSGGSLVLFSGEFSGGGSGLRSFALLKDEDGKIKNLLPEVELDPGADQKVWILQELSQMPILAFANPDWKVGEEAHYGDRHHYKITAYLYDGATKKYLKKIEYITYSKYWDESSSGDLGILLSEKEAIIRELNKAGV